MCVQRSWAFRRAQLEFADEALHVMNSIERLTATATPPPRRVCVATTVMHRSLGEEAVLLDMASTTYFGLNAVAARFWQLVSENPDFGMAVASLTAEFDVENNTLIADLTELCGRLSLAGLVTLE